MIRSVIIALGLLANAAAAQTGEVIAPAPDEECVGYVLAVAPVLDSAIIADAQPMPDASIQLAVGFRFNREGGRARASGSVVVPPARVDGSDPSADFCP